MLGLSSWAHKWFVQWNWQDCEHWTWKFRCQLSYRIKKKITSLRQSWPKYIDLHSKLMNLASPAPPKSMLGDGMSYHGPGTNIDLGERGLCRFGGLSQYFWPWLSEWGSFLLYPIWKLTSKFSGPMFTILSVSLDKPLMGPRWKTKQNICVI